jgi:hypothetical protein
MENADVELFAITLQHGVPRRERERK